MNLLSRPLVREILGVLIVAVVAAVIIRDAVIVSLTTLAFALGAAVSYVIRQRRGRRRRHEYP